VAAIYGSASVAWILITGWLAQRLPEPFSGQLETAKGLFFVLVTSLMLYALIYQWSARFLAEAKRAADAERTLAGVVDTVPVGVLIVDAVGTISFLNPMASRMIGLGAQDAIGRSLQDLCSTGDGSQVLNIGELLRNGTVVGLGLCGPDSAGGAVVGRAALLDPESPEKGWVVALADVTEAHRESRRFQALMQGYRFVSEAIAASARARDEHQLLQDVCEVAVHTGGYSGAFALEIDQASGTSSEVATAGLGQVSRETLSRLLRAETPEYSRLSSMLGDKELVICNDLRNDIANPWSAAAIVDGFGSSATFAATLPDGRILSMTLFAEQPGYFDHDQYTLLRALCSDVVFGIEKLFLERRRLSAEEALEASELAYRRLFQSSPQVMWVYDRRSLAFLAVNDAAVAKYGYSHDQFMVMTISDIRSAEDNERLAGHLARQPEGFGDQGYWQHRDASGREFPVHILTHSVDWEGRPAVLVLVQEVAQMG
jgi:PAS domain S-box-containing protein